MVGQTHHRRWQLRSEFWKRAPLDAAYTARARRLVARPYGHSGGNALPSTRFARKIEAVWKPGSLDLERFGGLPRS